MPKIVECVPNFSEGRNQEVIDAIADAIRQVAGVSLLDVDPGASTNRTVYTFVGDPTSIVEGALAAARAAFPLIDMTGHQGEHPRMGALDVCPFIPLQDVTVEECVEISKEFGSRLAQELGVPVFLYGFSSNRPYRKTMPQIREGQYEGLKAKLSKPEWQPDFGEAKFVPSWGATVTGVRKFLIAYNINMICTKEQAHRIALNLREIGRGQDQPGRLKAVQGIGWWLQESNIAQISLNLTDMDVTPMHVAFDEACKDAHDLKLPVTGSEIVGLVPLKAILDAADHFIAKENLFVLEEDQKVHLAIHRLGLSTLSPFDPKKRIVEYCLQKDAQPSAPCKSATNVVPETSVGADVEAARNISLASETVTDFVAQVKARSAAPGGGSVSALVGALGSALGTMVGQMTYGKKQWEHLDEVMRGLIPVLHDASQKMVKMIDEDSSAFNDYMEAMKLPKKTEEEKKLRELAMQAGLKKAVQVPLGLAMKVNEVWDAMLSLAQVGNINCKSDLQVGARCLMTALLGAVDNVNINLKDIHDDQFRVEIQKKTEQLIQTADDSCKKVLSILGQRV